MVVVEVLVVRSEVVMFVLGANSQVEGCAGWLAGWRLSPTCWPPSN